MQGHCQCFTGNNVNIFTGVSNQQVCCLHMVFWIVRQEKAFHNAPLIKLREKSSFNLVNKLVYWPNSPVS